MQYSLSSQYDGVLCVSLQWELNAKRAKNKARHHLKFLGRILLDVVRARARHHIRKIVCENMQNVVYAAIASYTRWIV